jgi:hypothetical protein
LQCNEQRPGRSATRICADAINRHGRLGATQFAAHHSGDLIEFRWDQRHFSADYSTAATASRKQNLTTDSCR